MTIALPANSFLHRIVTEYGVNRVNSFLMTSNVTLLSTTDSVLDSTAHVVPLPAGEPTAGATGPQGSVRVEKARGAKCLRCWKSPPEMATEHLCTRCQTVVQAAQTKRS